MKDLQYIVSKVLPLFSEIKNILQTKNISVEEKNGVGNFVTQVDKQIEEYIRFSLLELFPDSQVIGEEASENHVQNKPNSNLKFIVDPLDGTTNFTNGWPHTVSIGIIQNNELISGIIYDVLTGTIYTGIKGAGVMECNIDDITNLKKVTLPSYSQTTVKKAPISYDTPYGKEAFKVTLEMINELYQSGASLKTVGPISLDVLKTALGSENRPHDYNAATWHTEVRAWDLAAATCILRELGGEIIGKDGKPLSTETLSNPNARILFFASGSERILEELYSKYLIAEKNVDEKSGFNR